MTESTKRCPRCGEVKPRSDFWKMRTRADGLCPRCKACERARIRRLKDAHLARNLAAERAAAEAEQAL